MSSNWGMLSSLYKMTTYYCSIIQLCVCPQNCTDVVIRLLDYWPVSTDFKQFWVVVPVFLTGMRLVQWHLRMENLAPEQCRPNGHHWRLYKLLYTTVLYYSRHESCTVRAELKESKECNDVGHAHMQWKGWKSCTHTVKKCTIMMDGCTVMWFELPCFYLKVTVVDSRNRLPTAWIRWA